MNKKISVWDKARIVVYRAITEISFFGATKTKENLHSKWFDRFTNLGFYSLDKRSDIMSKYRD